MILVYIYIYIYMCVCVSLQAEELGVARDKKIWLMSIL